VVGAAAAANMGVHAKADANTIDEDDPSEAWVSQSFTGGGHGTHQPNGPLGCERTGPGASPLSPLSPITNGGGYPSSAGGGGVSKGIQINKKRNGNHAPHGLGIPGSPLTNSVQENFKGFTYHGGESVAAAMTVGVNGLAGRTRAQAKQEEEEAVEDEVSEVTTEDEFEDVGRSAGRYANTRKARFGDEDDFS